jgi:GntR family transcriptional regulator, transcriptional repressor for pyruvate dehydrogenase complex
MLVHDATMADSAPLRAQKLWTVVADQVRSQIARGELAPGDTLTLEADLLKQFQVSRPTLREALRVLESEGLIQLGRGARKGATVLGPSINTVAKHGALYLATQGTTIGEVHQVRTLIEPSMVAVLATKPSKECVQALTACAGRQRKAIEAGNHDAAVVSLDELHQLIIKYTDNRALSMLAGVLGNMPAMAYRQPLLTGSTAIRKAFQRRTEKSVEAHGQLVELIAARKPDKAEEFWRRYMTDTAEFLANRGLASLPIRAWALA